MMQLDLRGHSFHAGTVCAADNLDMPHVVSVTYAILLREKERSGITFDSELFYKYFEELRVPAIRQDWF